MTKNQNFELSMHLDVGSTCDTYETILDRNLSYRPARDKFDAGVNNEKSFAQRQEEIKKQSAESKALARKAATEFILDLSRKLMSYALNKGDMTLYDSIKLNKSIIEKCPDNKFELTFSTALNTAEDNIESLADYDITQATITKGETLLSTFVSEVQKLKNFKLELKKLTAKLNKELKATTLILKLIDAIVSSMQVSDPDLYTDYTNARQVKRSSAGRISIKGKVFDAATGEPLPGSIVTVTRMETGKALASGADLVKNVKVRSYGGGFDVKSMPTGTYQVTVSYAGYVDQSSTIYINEGYLTRVELPLNKIA